MGVLKNLALILRGSFLLKIHDFGVYVEMCLSLIVLR